MISEQLMYLIVGVGIGIYLMKYSHNIKYWLEHNWVEIFCYTIWVAWPICSLSAFFVSTYILSPSIYVFISLITMIIWLPIGFFGMWLSKRPMEDKK